MAVLFDILPVDDRLRSRTLADRRAGECAWPDPGSCLDMSKHTFCCEPVEAKGKPYCPGHTWDALAPWKRRGPRP